MIASWEELTVQQGACRDCATGCHRPLLDAAARPLFGRFQPWRRGVLFVLEAPNRSDTMSTDPYLTVDPSTDPTGRFTHALLTEELGLDPGRFQITNAVLCLPAPRGDKFPVSGEQMKRCAARLREQISALDPTVVAPVGGAALRALRQLDRHPYRSMTSAVARPVQWMDRWLFPLFHTGMLARNGPAGRRDHEQRADWRALRQFLVERGVEIPGPVC